LVVYRGNCQLAHILGLAIRVGCRHGAIGADREALILAACVPVLDGGRGRVGGRGLVDVPRAALPNKSQVMFIVAAPSESPANEIPLTFPAGLTRLPLELKVSDPVVLAPTGSWITLPLVEMLAPEMVNTPAAFEVTVTPRRQQ